MTVDTLGDLIATLGSIDDDEIDWQNIRQATVLIHQTFRYDYPGPITELRQRLIVVPPDYHGYQRLATHKLRELNQFLHGDLNGVTRVRVMPDGRIVLVSVNESSHLRALPARQP